MNYQQTLDYLYDQLPMFHRIGSAAYKANLDNTIAICHLLGNPQQQFKSVHIAGTNGKGSTSHMLASVLQSKGLKTGLYTSPHLKDFRERIKINGKKISQQYIVDFVQTYQIEFEKIKPSFFEWTVGLAFNYFAKQKVDIAVIETGLGGRLDSTNIINPILSVITNISYDHQHLLGNTLQKIAMEKAGIIKHCIPVVIGETQKEIKQVLIDKAKSEKSSIYFADKEYFFKNIRYKVTNKKQKLTGNVMSKNRLVYQNLECELMGLYQRKNIPTVLKCVDILNKNGFKIKKRDVKKGIAHVITNTGLMGRWQVIRQKPLTIADTGHNESGIKEIVQQLKQTPHHQLHLVLGVVNDKDISKILRLLPKSAHYYFCKANIPRALDEKELTEKAYQNGLKGKSFPSVKTALTTAINNAQKNDLIFVGGSTFVVGEAI